MTELEFDPFSDTFFVDPYPTYKRMRDEAPVYYNAEYGFYALSRYEDVAWGQKDFESFSSAYGIDLASVRMGKKNPQPMIILMDPPEHRRMRNLVSRVFTPRAIAELEPMVREVITGFLDACDPEGFDAVQDFAALFPVEIISQMLGVPPEHRQQIRHWLDDGLSRDPGELAMSKKGYQAMVSLGAFFFEQVVAHRADPQDDMITHLIDAEVPAEGDGAPTRLDDIEIAGFATLLGGAGAETVTKLVANGVVTLAEHPEVWGRLRDDRSLLPQTIEELLRYQAPSQYNVRRCIKDVELHGVRIPEGAAVFMLVGSANRDERAFTNADRFDIDRDTTEAQSIAFGYGIHSCLGSALARLETRVALGLLLDFLPEFQVDHGGLKRVAMQNVAGWSSVPTRRAGVTAA